MYKLLLVNYMVVRVIVIYMKPLFISEWICLVLLKLGRAESKKEAGEKEKPGRRRLCGRKH
jgi:hypothetical protein